MDYLITIALAYHKGKSTGDYKARSTRQLLKLLFQGAAGGEKPGIQEGPLMGPRNPKAVEEFMRVHFSSCAPQSDESDLHHPKILVNSSIADP